MKSFEFKKVRNTSSKKNQSSNQIKKDQDLVLFDVKETAKFLKLKPSYIYSLIHQKIIPHYKPNGKRVYFIKSELIERIRGSKVRTVDELEARHNKEKQTQTN